tara:strand:- start:190 stop:1269 length:1080 start_codon:yes stop_codon:yes gene_type:complete
MEENKNILEKVGFSGIIILMIIIMIGSFTNTCNAQIKKAFKFSTFYVAANGGTSLSDRDIFSVNTGALTNNVIKTPYDYSLSLGVRKIQRFQYENISKFKDGTESSYSDASTIGKSPFEYLFEVDYRRQEGIKYLDQNHFLRYVKPKWLIKVAYVKDGFADVEYYEATQRIRFNSKSKLSFNMGALQRISEPYGYEPLEEWLLSNGNLHYTQLAIEEGYSIDVFNSEYKNPDGNIVATSSEVWEEVVIPQVLEDYVERKKDELPNQWVHSLVLGFDFYHYKKDFWLHSWGNVMPLHYNNGGEFSYHNFNDGKQWSDYSGGVIFGYNLNRNVGCFVEGKYNKYWNRKWYDFKFGINYKIF